MISGASAAVRYDHVLRRALDAHLDALAAEGLRDDDGLLPSLEPLARIVRALRAAPARRREHVASMFLASIAEDAVRAEAIRRYVARIAASAYVSGALAELGVLADHGIFEELRARLVARILPSEHPPHDLREIFAELFEPADAKWVTEIDPALLLDLVKALAPLDPRRPLLFGTLRALELVGHRIAAAGEEPELGRFDPEARDHESPFLALASEISFSARAIREAFGTDADAAGPDVSHASVMLSQCRDAIGRLRRRAPRTGVTLSMTYQLERLDDLLDRASALLSCLVENDGVWTARAELVRRLVLAQAERERIGPLLLRGSRLVSTEITSRSARTGEHYIARTRGEWARMWIAAGGAGLVVACMAAIKVSIAALHAPPLLEALGYSLNYAGGFVIVGALGMTIATKQPAMTAAALASSIDASKPREARHLIETIQALSRSQLAAILGNCLVAAPAAFGLAWLFHAGDVALVTEEKAHHLVAELDPLASLAVPHAMLTGVYLSLSGLVAGYVGTSLSARHAAIRIARSSVLERLLGTERLQRIGRSIERSGGTVAGSVVLGFLLGMTGTLGALVGLPIDIRHVSFASANFGLALATLGPEGVELGRTLAGIGLIGASNLAVSFGISLGFALSARRCSLRDVPTLTRDLLRAFAFELPAWLVPVGSSAISSSAEASAEH